MRTKLCNWPEISPVDCGRRCNKFFEAHTTHLSFALYNHQTIDPTVICIYSFCCGNIIQRKHALKEDETLQQTLATTMKELIFQHSAMAIAEREERCLRNN